MIKAPTAISGDQFDTRPRCWLSLGSHGFPHFHEPNYIHLQHVKTASLLPSFIISLHRSTLHKTLPADTGSLNKSNTKGHKRCFRGERSQIGEFVVVLASIFNSRHRLLIRNMSENQT